jgi:hypothetical protein
MSELINVRIQIGVDKPNRFLSTVPSDTTVDDFRVGLRQDQGIDPSFGVVLIYNGRQLNDSDATLYDIGICNDSLIICIISENTGREIEGLFSDEEVENEQDYKNACEAEFHARPFGFAVLGDEHGKNAIVTKVTKRSTIHWGVKIGYCVYRVNDLVVFGKEHKEVLNCLKKVDCPVSVQFIDRGSEETIIFTSKPLGFTVIQDKEKTNAKVTKTEKSAASKGVKIGSHIVLVNGVSVFGRLHVDICSIINKATFPISITFRRPPNLRSVSTKRQSGRSKRNLMKLTRQNSHGRVDSVKTKYHIPLPNF